jgi:hypothetical protein
MALEWTESVFNFKGQAEYNATPPTLANGEAAPLQVTNTGALKVALVSGDTAESPHTLDNSGGLVAERLIKSGSGYLYEIAGSNEGTTKLWAMWFDSTTRPANGTAPKDQGGVEPGIPFGFSYSRGYECVNGIYFCVSSTAGTLTYASGGQFFFTWDIL